MKIEFPPRLCLVISGASEDQLLATICWKYDPLCDEHLDILCQRCLWHCRHSHTSAPSKRPLDKVVVTLERMTLRPGVVIRQQDMDALSERLHTAPLGFPHEQHTKCQ